MPLTTADIDNLRADGWRSPEDVAAILDAGASWEARLRESMYIAQENEARALDEIGALKEKLSAAKDIVRKAKLKKVEGRDIEEWVAYAKNLERLKKDGQAKLEIMRDAIVCAISDLEEGL